MLMTIYDQCCQKSFSAGEDFILNLKVKPDTLLELARMYVKDCLMFDTEPSPKFVKKLNSFFKSDESIIFNYISILLQKNQPRAALDFIGNISNPITSKTAKNSPLNYYSALAHYALGNIRGAYQLFMQGAKANNGEVVDGFDLFTALTRFMHVQNQEDKSTPEKSLFFFNSSDLSNNLKYPNFLAETLYLIQNAGLNQNIERISQLFELMRAHAVERGTHATVIAFRKNGKQALRQEIKHRPLLQKIIWHLRIWGL